MESARVFWFSIVLCLFSSFCKTTIQKEEEWNTCANNSISLYSAKKYKIRWARLHTFQAARTTVAPHTARNGGGQKEEPRAVQKRYKRSLRWRRSLTNRDNSVTKTLCWRHCRIKSAKSWTSGGLPSPLMCRFQSLGSSMPRPEDSKAKRNFLRTPSVYGQAKKECHSESRCSHFL